MTKSEKTLRQKEKLLVLSNFFFCHYVFKNPSAAEASESVYMRERVNYKHKGTCTLKWIIFGLEIKFLLTLSHIQQICSRRL